MAEITIEAILFGLGVLAFIIAYLRAESGKKHSAKDFGLFGIAMFAILGLMMVGTIGNLQSIGGVAPLSPVSDDEVIQQAEGACDVNGVCVQKPYTTFGITTHEMFSNAYDSVAGTVHFFDDGMNPSLASTNARETITVTSGIGNTTDGVLKTGTNYVVVFEGTNHYDQWYNAKAFPMTSMLPYVETTEAAISTQSIEFNNVMAFATISDPFDESVESVLLNGQTNTSGLASNSNELQVGADDTPANSDIIYYNITNGDGQFYIDLTIGSTGSNAGLRDPVIAIVNSLTAPFDKNEFTLVLAERQSGTDFGIPGTVTDYFNDATPIPLYVDNEAFMPAGRSAVYRFTFTVNEANLAAGGDEINFYVDDNGGYLGQDIMRGTKATVSQEVTIAVRA